MTAFELPGHFPGHMGLRIAVGRLDEAILIADAAVHPKMLARAGTPSTSRTRTRRRAPPTRRALLSTSSSTSDVLTVCGHYPAARHRPRGHARRTHRLGARVTAFREAFPILHRRRRRAGERVLLLDARLRGGVSQRGRARRRVRLPVAGAVRHRPRPASRRRDARDFALWIYADDVDAAAADLRAAGAEGRSFRRPTSRGASGCARSSTRTAISSTSVRRPSEACVSETQAPIVPRNHAGSAAPKRGLCFRNTKSPGCAHELAARRRQARPRAGADGRAGARRARRPRARQRPLPDELLGDEGLRRGRLPA